MKIDEALYAHLSADAGVTALCSGAIYPEVMPETVVSAWADAGRMTALIVYTVGSTAEGQSHSGRLGVCTSELQISAHVGSYATARAVLAAIKAAVLKSVLGWGTLRVWRVAVAPVMSIDWNNDTLAYVATMSVEIQHDKEV